MLLAPKDLECGDHVYVKRTGRFYTHHGIYTEDGTVIHYTGQESEKRDPLVTETSLPEFLRGGRLRRRAYGTRLAGPAAARLAREQLSSRGYSLAFNNCEHFATYCATGKRKSRQVRRALGSLAGFAVAVATAAVLRKKGKRREI